MSASGIPAPRSAYVHIPFCASKCGYCDFNSYPGLQELYDGYVDALIVEIRRAAGECRPDGGLETLYLGGGTPTVLTVNQLALIAKAVKGELGLAADAEVTVEANPGTVDWPMLARLPAVGFNRLSLGVQSLDDGLLRVLGRAHTSRQALETFRIARQTGWKNIGIDLMFALPGQTMSGWRDTLEAGVALNPEHVSLYELSIEEGTAFARDPELLSGDLRLPDESLRLGMYELAIRVLTGAGYEHYEVSNFARPEFRSRHNQLYWRNEPYYGFGAGATSYVGGVRARRIAQPADYIDAVRSGGDAVESSERLSGRALLGETVALGLRTLDGIDIPALSARLGVDLSAELAEGIDRLRKRGLIALDDGRLRVTHAGLLVLDDVAREFIVSQPEAS